MKKSNLVFQPKIVVDLFSLELQLFLLYTTYFCQSTNFALRVHIKLRIGEEKLYYGENKLYFLTSLFDAIHSPFNSGKQYIGYKL